MIIWLTGNSGSGKSALAKELVKRLHCNMVLDGDSMRKIWTDLDLSMEGRMEQNLRVARLAKYLEEQKCSIIVAVIAPTKKIREAVKNIIDCKWVYLDRPSNVKDLNKYPYEIPKQADVVVFPDTQTVEQEASIVMGMLKVT